MARLQDANVPAGPVRTVAKAYASPKVKARGLARAVTHEIAGAVPNIGPPFRFSHTPTAAPVPAPALGKHSQAVLGELLGAERWVRSVKEECLSKVILFGERSLRRALSDYVDHFHAERNHQGKGNVQLFPRNTDRHREGPVQCRERLGGLLRYYNREAA
jgi:hypothetical protein